MKMALQGLVTAWPGQSSLPNQPDSTAEKSLCVGETAVCTGPAQNWEKPCTTTTMPSCSVSSTDLRLAGCQCSSSAGAGQNSVPLTGNKVSISMLCRPDFNMAGPWLEDCPTNSPATQPQAPCCFHSLRPSDAPELCHPSNHHRCGASQLLMATGEESWRKQPAVLVVVI